jgi:curli production assembly/transport component CsgE
MNISGLANQQTIKKLKSSSRALSNILRIFTNKNRCIIIIFALMVPISTVWAQDLKEDGDVELEGILVDRTITHLGHEFYQYFSNAWIAQGGTERYNLVVNERPSARWGSLIWIEHEHRQVYRRFVYPGRGDIKITAEQASQSVTQTLLFLDRQMWIPDADLDTNGY